MDCLISSQDLDRVRFNASGIQCCAFGRASLAQLCALPCGGSGRADFRRLGHFHERTGFYIVKIAVDRDGWRHEWVPANAPHIGNNASMNISDRQPVDELASVRAWPCAAVMPALRVNNRLLQAPRQQAANNFIGERLHATVGVMDYKPLACAEKLVADQKRANSVIAGAATGIANHCASPSARPANFAGSSRASMQVRNREAPRGWHGEPAFSAK